MSVYLIRFKLRVVELVLFVIVVVGVAVIGLVVNFVVVIVECVLWGQQQGKHLTPTHVTEVKLKKYFSVFFFFFVD